MASPVERVDYTPKTRTLDVWYKGGSRYSYLDVPGELYRRLLDSPSIGTFISVEVAETFEAERLRGSVIFGKRHSSSDARLQAVPLAKFRPKRGITPSAANDVYAETHPQKSSVIARFPIQPHARLMPVVSLFFGIVIRMYHDDHPPPHFHASYQGFEAFIVIETGEILYGELPKRAARIVRQWALDRHDELMANWARGESLLPMEMIPGADVDD